MNLLVPGIMTPTVYLGFLYLCALPATVQSAIAFTSAAGGNVAAAICSASASSILGVFLSPLLVGALMHTGRQYRRAARHRFNHSAADGAVRRWSRRGR